MPDILLVEDDPAVVRAVTAALALEKGYRLTSVGDAERALERAAAARPDLVLLDVMLPGADGLQFLRRLRAERATAAVPVIVLSGLGSERDRVLGLTLGADDYLPKPFSARELAARVAAVLRRGRPPGPGEGRAALRVGPLELDPEAGAARYRGRAMALRPREFEILYLLASHPGRALSRAYLNENARAEGLPASPRSVDAHVKNIRRRLGPAARLVETVPRRGYRLAAPP